MTGQTRLSRRYERDLARSLALPPGRSRGKKAAFTLHGPLFRFLRTSRGLNPAPSDSNVRCSANELLVIPNDARGPALHALLGTQCAAPSCPSPHRGYQTVISEHVPPCGSPRPGRLETRSSGGPVEHHPLLFGFHPWTFCVKRRGCKPAGPQHLPSVPVSAFRFTPRRGRRSEKPRIA